MFANSQKKFLYQIMVNIKLNDYTNKIFYHFIFNFDYCNIHVSQDKLFSMLNKFYFQGNIKLKFFQTTKQY